MALHPTATVLARRGERTGADEVGGRPGAAWSDIEARLRTDGPFCWLSLRSETGVHTRPVFAAWTGTSFVTASKPSTAKTGLLEEGRPGSLAVDLGVAHLTLDVVPARLTAPEDLERAVAAFLDVYDWPTTVLGDEIDAPYAAPTSGGPPFRVFELTPLRGFALPTSDQFEPTRFDF